TAPQAAPNDTGTLIAALDWHATHQPERVHIRFHEDEGEGATISYRELLDGATQMATGLQARGITKGDPVVLMLQTGPDYFYCFFGVLLAGGIPVPVYPPARAAQLEDHIRRQRG